MPVAGDSDRSAIHERLVFDRVVIGTWTGDPGAYRTFSRLH